MLCRSFWAFVGLALLWKVYQWVQWITCRPDYTGKIVFISGGSSGIGENLAKRIVNLGAKKVIIAARRQTELERVVNECKEQSKKLETCVLDLNNPVECLQKC